MCPRARASHSTCALAEVRKGAHPSASSAGGGWVGCHSDDRRQMFAVARRTPGVRRGGAPGAGRAAAGVRPGPSSSGPPCGSSRRQPGTCWWRGIAAGVPGTVVMSAVRMFVEMPLSRRRDGYAPGRPRREGDAGAREPSGAWPTAELGHPFRARSRMGCRLRHRRRPGPARAEGRQHRLRRRLRRGRAPRHGSRAVSPAAVVGEGPWPSTSWTSTCRLRAPVRSSTSSSTRHGRSGRCRPHSGALPTDLSRATVPVTAFLIAGVRMTRCRPSAQRVRPAGIEPATKCLEGTCSIH